MICSKCKNPGVLNKANGKDFYYCRTCKDEIGLEIVKKSTEYRDAAYTDNPFLKELKELAPDNESDLLSDPRYQTTIYDPDALGPSIDLWTDLAHEMEFADKVSQIPTPSTSYCNICQGFH